jgi:hypothetical protein
MHGPGSIGTVYNAIERLKEQFWQFRMGLAPFNQPLQSGETLLQFWQRLNKDRKAQPLAVRLSMQSLLISHTNLHLKHLGYHMVALVSNSMGDECIQPSMTWRHTSPKSNLSIKTLLREIQVTMWDTFNPKVSLTGLIIRLCYHIDLQNLDGSAQTPTRRGLPRP